MLCSRSCHKAFVRPTLHPSYTRGFLSCKDAPAQPCSAPLARAFLLASLSVMPRQSRPRLRRTPECTWGRGRLTRCTGENAGDRRAHAPAALSPDPTLLRRRWRQSACRAEVNHSARGTARRVNRGRRAVCVCVCVPMGFLSAACWLPYEKGDLVKLVIARSL